MTFKELAESLGTTIYVLMEFAPDYFPATMPADAEVPEDVRALVRQEWRACLPWEEFVG